jgi:hypothetical protein
MATALYRISSNEVIEISLADNQFHEELDNFKAVITDPTLSDGSEFRDPNGDYRVLGYAKFNDSGTVRNATQEEIDTFAASQADDRNQRDATRAKEYFQDHPQFRRIMTAFASILVDEFNILRAEHSLNDRTLSQLKTAILNRIDKDD